MRLILRVDDIGRNPACNNIACKAIELGIATAVHVCLDGPETEYALRQLRNYPWISVGWQSDFRGKPVRPSEKVKTLVDRGGNYRPDLTTAPDVSRIESLLELRAELFRCTELLGRTPSYRNRVFSKTSPFGRAIGEIDQEFGIISGFVWENETDLAEAPELPWAERNLVRAEPLDFSGDPVDAFLRLGDKLLSRDENTWISRWPGERAEALCDQRLRNWIVENGVELVNYRDALFGTRDYQNYLRSIGSDLSVL